MKRSTLRRVLRGALYLKIGFALFIVAAIGLLYLRIAAGPLSFGGLPERVADALATRIGPGWKVTLRNTALELRDGSPALRANGLDIRAPDGNLVLRAPYALVSVDGLSLLTANLQPRSIEFRDMQLRVLVKRDGSLAFSPVAQGEGGDVAAPPAPAPADTANAPPRDPNGPSPVSGVVGSLFDVIVGPQSALNSLGRAQLTNARLVFIDADYRERARFQRLDATFDWTQTGGRRFEATVEGPQGAWQITGDAVRDEAGRYRATLLADSAPIQDLLVLAGLSALPASTDLDFSGRVDAAFADGRVTELKARLDSGAGTVQVEDKDTSPLRVERASIDVDWSETQKTLNLNKLELIGGDTKLALQGKLSTATATEPWRLSLLGRDATLPGAAPGDQPVRLDEIAADLSGPDGIEIKSLTIKGPDVAVIATGQVAPSADPHALSLDLRVTKTNVRSALRIMPEAVAPKVRRFLVANLKAGTLEYLNFKAAMTGADMDRALAGEALPASSIKLEFAISGGVLKPSEGLAPVSRMDVIGFVTGTRAVVRATTGRIDMAGDHSLNASDGSFVVDNYWADNAIGRINFRLSGGANGLGALLQEPKIKEIAAIEVDPATMKGRTNLRVGIDLDFGDLPAFADLPLTVNGTVSDLVVDKVFGKERLENAALTIAYDKGDLAIKGEGRLAGSPATIDVRKNRQGGEANVAFTLDEAARARRGLSFGSQLTGPLPLKIVVPLGKSARPGPFIEADLTRAAVDQLIPGWVKPAGRPGKICFVLVEGPSTELRELVIDSGPVQLRGSAVLTAEGNLEKADLTTFKMSPGDDMKAQIERAGSVLKVTVRGNVGDARPFLKAASSPSPAPSQRGAAAQARETKDTKDYDLDLALNILTGHNEEAITNAAIKASVRKDNIRQLDLKGRLGSTNILARTVPQAGSPNPAIILQADSAGQLLRFLDIYTRMSGGSLVLQMGTGDGPQPGVVILDTFSLNNEPALRRIIPTQTQFIAGQDQAGNPQMVRIDFNEVVFTKARVDFTRSPGRLDFRDGAIYGNQVGFTLGGFIDYARDRIDISGTFVPAYGLNNAFAKVPLFGPLLGGGQHEGLFAVNFRVTGQASTPTLTVNPLSAVAPGFLRKLFGVGAEEEAGAIPLPRPSDR